MSKPRRRSSQSLGFAGSAPTPEATPLEAMPLLSAPPEDVALPVDGPPGSEDDRPVSRTVSPVVPRQDSNRSNAAAIALGHVSGEPRPKAPAASEVLFDAWHASFSDQFTLPLARKHLEGSSGYVQLFAGEDDRRTPPDVQKGPWHSICSLVITGPGGARWAGTGWLAGPRTVVTAGHCLYFHGRSGAGQWAEQVEVLFPNLGQTAEPIRATDFLSVGGWVEGRNIGADYGAILFPATANLAEAVPLPYAAIPDAEIGQDTVIVAGYCTDKQPRTLWGFARNIREAQPRQFLFDRSVFGGVSGGPVLMWKEKVWTVVGIQQDGDFAGNVAVRFTPDVCRNISSWVGQAGS